MNNLVRCSILSLALWASAGQALGPAGSAGASGQGLAPPNPQAWWPQWQARVSLQAAPLALASPALGAAFPSSLLSSNAASRGVQGGALLGDYYFASPALGQFRASGGLTLGQTGGAPLAFAPGLAAGNNGPGPVPSRMGLTLLGGGPAPGLWPAEASDAAPYLGLGYSASLWGDSVAVSADWGLVYQRQAEALGRRALFGNQGASQSQRDLRLMPVMQLGVRYTF